MLLSKLLKKMRNKLFVPLIFMSASHELKTPFRRYKSCLHLQGLSKINDRLLQLNTKDLVKDELISMIASIKMLSLIHEIIKEQHDHGNSGDLVQQIEDRTFIGQIK